ncbi:hypothetical protein [Bradyrhizobium sp. BRP56]|uniref:hypothetical protein n=1 Tax=Bradyrhizobium sp. BRP56 TaxID=2793819 RepID=UPI001CD2D6BF|nr:hypothetical protein [Bradyrhizobium sp. BRP56]
MAVLVRAIQLTDYDLRRALRSNWSKNVTIAFTLLLTSTLVGLATSLYFRVWTLMLESPLVAVLAAIVLQSDGFSFATGAPIVVACLAFNQFAYLAGALLSPEINGSMAEEIDGLPDRRGEHDIRGQNE